MYLHCEKFYVTEIIPRVRLIKNALKFYEENNAI